MVFMKETCVAILLGLTAVLATAQTSEKAHVLFYRPHNTMMGVALKPSIYFGRIKVASLPNGRYFEVEATPRKYTLRADDMALFAENSVDLTAGEHYYVRMSLVGTKKALLVGSSSHLQLDVIPRDEALTALKKLKPLDQPPYLLDSTVQTP
jgi:hypothetical protein